MKERKAFEHQAENKAAAMYAARKVLDALGNMFVNAKNVMDWLNECARDIAQHGASRGARKLADRAPLRLLRRVPFSLAPCRAPQRAPCGGAHLWACRSCRCACRGGVRAPLQR